MVLSQVILERVQFPQKLATIQVRQFLFDDFQLEKEVFRVFSQPMEIFVLATFGRAGQGAPGVLVAPSQAGFAERARVPRKRFRSREGFQHRFEPGARSSQGQVFAAPRRGPRVEKGNEFSRILFFLGREFL